MTRRFGNRGKRSPSPNPLAGNLSVDRPAHSNTFTTRSDPYRNAIEAACDRFEKAKEFDQQHGPVRILVRNFKPVRSLETETQQAESKGRAGG